FEGGFDTLEASALTDQHLAGVVHVAAFFIFHAGIVVQIHAPFDQFTAAQAFNGEDVVAFLRFGGRGKKFFEKVHDHPSCLVSYPYNSTLKAESERLISVIKTIRDAINDPMQTTKMRLNSHASSMPNSAVMNRMMMSNAAHNRLMAAKRIERRINCA